MFCRYHGSYLALYEIIFCLGKNLIQEGRLHILMDITTSLFLMSWHDIRAADMNYWIHSYSIEFTVLFSISITYSPNLCRYEEVIQACALDVDISAMARGDMSYIGEKGTNLSGGQRARLALARSCFSNFVHLIKSFLSSLTDIMKTLAGLCIRILIYTCLMTSLARLTPKLLHGSWKRPLWGRS